MRTIPQNPDVILERLNGLHPKLIDLSLDRVERLLDRLGNPHHKLPPVVHVAGTNGKGSVIAFMRAGLEAAGYKVHVYTSPHLVRFNERIVLAGQIITDEQLAPILEACEEANRDDPITFFEITTVAAFVAFARFEADIVLLETGLGGRLDATNLIERPALTVITPVSIDHQQFLGGTVAEIAAEKAGILKPGVTCVCAAQPAPAADVIANQARIVGAPLIVEGVDFSFDHPGEDWTVSLKGQELRLPAPALPGKHQYQNAALAVASLAQLEPVTMDDAAFAQGMKSVTWPARLQCLTEGPLVDALPDGWALWLDGGHNQAAGEALAAYCQDWRDRPLYLIFGMLESKDPKPFLQPLQAITEKLIGVQIPGVQASLSADDVQTTAEAIGFRSTAAPGVHEALDEIIRTAPSAARVLICGSLYLAGAVLKENR